MTLKTYPKLLSTRLFFQRECMSSEHCHVATALRCQATKSHLSLSLSFTSTSRSRSHSHLHLLNLSLSRVQILSLSLSRERKVIWSWFSVSIRFGPSHLRQPEPYNFNLVSSIWSDCYRCWTSRFCTQNPL